MPPGDLEKGETDELELIALMAALRSSTTWPTLDLQEPSLLVASPMSEYVPKPNSGDHAPGAIELVTAWVNDGPHLAHLSLGEVVSGTTTGQQ